MGRTGLDLPHLPQLRQCQPLLSPYAKGPDMTTMVVFRETAGCRCCWSRDPGPGHTVGMGQPSSEAGALWRLLLSPCLIQGPRSSNATAAALPGLPPLIAVCTIHSIFNSPAQPRMPELIQRRTQLLIAVLKILERHLMRALGSASPFPSPSALCYLPVE